MSITRDEMRDLLREQARIISGSRTTPGTSGPSAPSSASGAFSSDIGRVTESLSPLSKGFSMATDAAGKLKDGFKYVYDAVGENIDMMKDLSKSGMNFSGDVVGMTAGIKGMRVSNEEFSDIMKKNSAGFTALGGNVTRGAEAFTKLAGDFQRSEFTDSLIAAGYTNKELNEVLAMQLTTGKMALRDDKESKRVAIESAAALAKEMDMMAKLTGKSREEQMATMQKLKDDMAIEAKLRQQTAGMGEIEAAEYRKKVMAEMSKAEMEGRGQLLKETFLHGQAVSEEAAMQQITIGNAAFQNTVNQGRALAEKNFKEAEEQGKSARRATVDFQKSAEGLQIAMLPGQQAITEGAQKSMKANQAYYDSLAAISQEAAFKGKSTAEIEKEAERRVKEASEGRDKEGKQVNQTTEAMVKLQQRSKEVESAFYNHLIVPLEKDLRPSIKQISDQFLKGQVRKAGESGTTSTETVLGEAIGKSYERGKQSLPEGTSAKDRSAEDAKRTAELSKGLEHLGPHVGKAVVEGIKLSGQGAADAKKLAEAASNMAVSGVQPKGKRSTGSFGMTGKLFEDFGEGTLMELHGKETVMTEKDLMSLMGNVQKSSKIGMGESILGNIQKSAKLGMGELIPENIQKNTKLGMGETTLPFKSRMGELSTSEMTKSIQANSSSYQAQNPVQSQPAPQRADTPGKDKEPSTEKASMSIKEKKATLDDVVSSLNQLNSKMAQLIDTSIDIGSKQVRATQSRSSNIYERV